MRTENGIRERTRKVTKIKGTTVAPAGIHATVLHLLNSQIGTIIILRETRTRGNDCQMMMTAPSMEQFTSGANVTKTNMVKISGPVAQAIAI